MTIGDFSRATRLSAKALRFYHRSGLLTPTRVDPVNGYRLYTAEQIADAGVVRHLRSLDMPVAEVREVLSATSPADRDALVAGHLARMEAQLERTRAAVAALRSLLAGPAPVEVTRRSVPAVPALVVRGTIDLADLGDWFTAATAELERAVAAGVVRPVGPRGGVWDTRLFLEERGEALLFVPVAALADHPDPPGRLRAELLPAVELAVAVHRGPDATIGEVYAALGAHAARHAVSLDGPVREWYLEGPGGTVTEIGWPVAGP